MHRPSQRRVHREPFRVNNESVLGRAVRDGLASRASLNCLNRLSQMFGCFRLLSCSSRALSGRQHNTWADGASSWCPLGCPGALQARCLAKHKPFPPCNTTQWLLKEGVLQLFFYFCGGCVVLQGRPPRLSQDLSTLGAPFPIPGQVEGRTCKRLERCTVTGQELHPRHKVVV